jgi:hypothetical protein
MAEKVIIRGDSYTALRPLYTYTLVNDLGQPFNLTGCTVRTTYKTATTDPNTDTTDSTAAIKHDLIIDLSGNVTTSNGLTLVSGVAGGVIQEVLTRAETLALPVGVSLKSDLELVTPNETVTFISDDTLKAVDAYTNRGT